MYAARPGLVIGFHGCEQSRKDQLLIESAILPLSEKPYDWLGHGMYFWENNYDRAMQWAIDKIARERSTENPAVIGALIDLGYCFDLVDDRFISMLQKYHRLMKMEHDAVGKPLPANQDGAVDPHKDKLMRFLDCATIQFMHDKIRAEAAGQVANKGYTSLKLFDSVRGVFQEGGEAFPGAGIAAKSHVQFCVRNANCIKGFFARRDEIDFFQQELDRMTTP